MILDKTSIEELLCTDGNQFEKIARNRSDGIFIRTDTEQNQFDKNQIGNDSIDLQIADYGFVMKSEFNYINTLSEENFEKYYKKVNITEHGYIINPGDLLFVPTFERIALSGDLIGRVTGRSVFARMGLSVHCTQDKFSSGINSVVGLQVINNSPIPLKIFPRQKLAQLLIEKTGKNRHPYKGLYCAERNYTLPIVGEKDRNQYDDLTKRLIRQQIPKKLPLKNRKTNNTLSLCKLLFPAITTIVMGVFGVCSQIPGMVATGILEIVGLIFFAMIEYEVFDKE